MKNYCVKLPPEGFILRDFIITFFSFLAHKNVVGMKTYPDRLELVPNAPPSAIADEYIRTIDEAIPRESPPHRGRNDASIIKKFVNKVSGLLNREVGDDLNNALIQYCSWINHSTIDQVFSSLSQLSWIPCGRTRGEVLMRYGRNADISALQIFKAEFYEGQKSFLAGLRGERFKAEIRLDIHTFVLSFAGAKLCKVISKTLENKVLGIYLSLLDPGAYELCSELNETIRGTEGYIAPDSIFQLLVALALRTKGILPLRLFLVDESGLRPTIVFHQVMTVDDYTCTFSNMLYRVNRLKELLCWALRNWRTENKYERQLLHVIHKLALAIQLSISESKVEYEHLYAIMRSLYGGKELVESLRKIKVNGKPLEVSELEDLISDVCMSLKILLES